MKLEEAQARSIRELAKQAELWIGSLRYGLNEERIKIDWLHDLNQLHQGHGLELFTSMGCNANKLIKNIIKKIKDLGYEVPEEIKNRLLLSEAFIPYEYEAPSLVYSIEHESNFIKIKAGNFYRLDDNL